MKIHMVLQGKGGVGKSFVAAPMAQFLQDKGRDPLCIDTDPVNATFAGYSAFRSTPSISWRAARSTHADLTCSSTSSPRPPEDTSSSITARAPSCRLLTIYSATRCPPC